MTDHRAPVNPKDSYDVVFLFPIGRLKDERSNYYDSTRHYWRVAPKWQARKNAIAIGIINQFSESAFRIQEWHNSGEKAEFTGDSVEEHHELLHRDFRSVISHAKGSWGFGQYLIVEFDGKGRFRILHGKQDKNWIELPSQQAKSTVKVKAGSTEVGSQADSSWRKKLMKPNSDINTWIFQINPQDYNLQKTELDVEEDWHINKFRSEISPGDRAIIWLSGSRAGVYGIARITSEAFVRGQDEKGRDELAVKLKLLQIWKEPIISKAKFIENPVLGKMAIITGPMGTNFKVSAEQWEVLKKLLPNSTQPTIDDEIDLNERISRGTTSSIGFQRDTERKRAVEHLAMSRAREYFVAQGWNVDSTVALTRPYDLLCTKSDTTALRVEVKGTETNGTEILLTRNEVKNTEEHSHTALFVVYNITVNFVDDKPHATGGDIRVIDPWNIDPNDLEATQFRYKLPQ